MSLLRMFLPFLGAVLLALLCRGEAAVRELKVGDIVREAGSVTSVNAMRPFEDVDEMKEERCPVVSGADIVVMATRDALVLAKDMLLLELDLERGVNEQGTVGAPAHQVQAMAEDEVQEHLTLELLRVHHQADGGAAVIAGETNHGHKKWLPYWLLAAASVIILTNHVRSSPTDQLFPPELAMFVVLLCAICLILRAMKQMM